MRTNVLGTVYLLHFDRPYVGKQSSPDKRLQSASHYLGWSEDLIARLTAHAKGNGDCANLLRVIKDNGIGWELARVWENVDRHYERSLKRQGGRRRFCPICLGTGTAIPWQQTTCTTDQVLGVV